MWFLEGRTVQQRKQHVKRPQGRDVLVCSKRSKLACVAGVGRARGRLAGDDVKEVIGQTLWGPARLCEDLISRSE